MADNAFVKIGTALLKHQVKKLVGEEAMGAIGAELADIGGDKLDAWLGDTSTIAEIEKAAGTARELFHGKVIDDEVEQWMVMLPIHDLPDVLSALEELPSSPDETKLENALRDSVALNWKQLSPEQINHAVNSFLSCLRSALLPIEEQTLMVIGRSVLRIEEKVDQLAKLVEQLKPYTSDSQSGLSVGRLTVGGNVGGSVVLGNKNVVTQITNNYYQQIVEKNIEKHEPDFWALKHPYPMPRNFTGRIAERAMLTDWLNDDSENRLFILRALGGFGKSALTWYWLTHDVNPETWTKVVFWSFYEGDASFENFTRESLEYLGIEVPKGGHPQVDELLKAMQRENILLIMDGFERVLRLYASMNAAYQREEEVEEEKIEENQLDCKDINAEWFLKGICSNPKIKSKVLMTTRHSPSAIKPRGEFMFGCHEVELTSIQPADAVEFFHKQGIEGHRAEIEAACEPYGYHPLSLRLLAGCILKDFENPADIAVAQKFKIDGNIIAQKHHVLEVSYKSMPTQERKLLSTIACFRSSVKIKNLEAINIGGQNIMALQDYLHDLVERGLLYFEGKNKTFDLHPIIRRYAYQKLGMDDRASIHKQLQDFYLPIVKSLPKPNSVTDLMPAIELYYHTAAIDEADRAWIVYRTQLHQPLRYQLGKYQIALELLSLLFYDNSIDRFKSRNTDFLSWVLNEISNCLCFIGQPKRAIKTFTYLYEIDMTKDNKGGIASGVSNIASLVHIPLGNFKLAEANLRLAIKIDKGLNRIYEEADDRLEIGRLLLKKGAWFDSEYELSKSLDISKKISNIQMQTVIWAYRAMRFLHMLRDKSQFQVKYINLAIEYSERSIKLADKTTNSTYTHPVDYVRAYWLLGSAFLINNELKKSEDNLLKSINLCRQINLVDHEADILLDLARLRFAQGDFKDAQEKASEALMITERSGYVLQGADVNLLLAQYALEQEKDKVKAKEYAESALKLATCDGPPYYYKVAYDEALAMLEKLK